MAFGTLIVTHPGGRRELVEITKPTLDIGAAAESDVLLEDTAAQPVHIQLLCDDGGCQVLDLGSDAGTRLNGVPLLEYVPEPLPNKSMIQIGATTLQFMEPRLVVAALPSARRRRGGGWLAAGLIVAGLAVGGYAVRDRIGVALFPTPSATPGAVASAAPAVNVTAAAPRSFVVATTTGQRLNIRATPSEAATTVGQLANGTVVRLLDGPIVAEGAEWVRIEGANLTGWCVLAALRPQ